LSKTTLFLIWSRTPPSAGAQTFHHKSGEVVNGPSEACFHSRISCMVVRVSIVSLRINAHLTGYAYDTPRLLRLARVRRPNPAPSICWRWDRWGLDSGGGELEIPSRTQRSSCPASRRSCLTLNSHQATVVAPPLGKGASNYRAIQPSSPAHSYNNDRARHRSGCAGLGITF